jgi:tetratricopeptide (TPR) repeat protein
MNQTRMLWVKVVSGILILFGATFFTYKEALNGGLAWDAGSYLLDNPFIMSFCWENIKWMFTTFYLSNWHPLTWLSYTMDYVVYRDIWGVALTNIILHCANSALVFIFSLVIINIHYNRKNIAFNQSPNNELLAAFIAALLFGLHPQHVESVAWLAERKDVLCQLFVLTTFICYMAYVRSGENRKRNGYYLLTLVCFLMALLSKPIAVTVPILLLIGDFYPLQRVLIEEFGWSQIRKILIEKIPFFALSLMLALLTLAAQTAAIAPLDKFSLQVRLLNASKSAIVYISKLLFPINLLPLYDEFPNPANFSSLIPVITILLITVVFLYLWFKKQKFWLAAWMFYLVALLPVAGIVQVGVQSTADRYAYLPTVPFYILIGCGFSSLFYWLKAIYLRVAVLLGMATIAIILSAMTGNQIPIWKSDLFLWKYITKVLPEHGPAHTNLGIVYFNQGNYEKAIEHYEKAGSLGKIFLEALPHWALSYLQLGRLDQALQIYKMILERKEEIKKEFKVPISCIHYNVGLIYARKNQIDKAKEFFVQVELDSPEEFFIARRLLAIIESNRLEQNNGGIKAFTPYNYCYKYHVYTARRAAATSH